MEFPKSDIIMRIFPQSLQQQPGLSLSAHLWGAGPWSCSGSTTFCERNLRSWCCGFSRRECSRSRVWAPASPLPSPLQGTASCCRSWRKGSSPRGTRFTSAWTWTSPASWTAAPCRWSVMRSCTSSTPCTRAGVSGSVPGWIPSPTGTWRRAPFPATAGERGPEWPLLRAGI